MKEEVYIENYFKILSLVFWPIIWYKWIVISNETIEIILVATYTVMCIGYTVYYLYLKNKFDYKVEKIDFYYKFSTLLAFLITLYSFLLFPKNITALLLKLFLIGLFFYFSVVKTVRYGNEEGVVGIMASLLLAIITIFY